jgi:hypothetical protein
MGHAAHGAENAQGLTGSRSEIMDAEPIAFFEKFIYKDYL